TGPPPRSGPGWVAPGGWWGGQYDRGMGDAVVVGSGPNGLAAAVALGPEGAPVPGPGAARRHGGGPGGAAPRRGRGACRPRARRVAPPFLSPLDLDRDGLRWAWPEVDLAHPLDSGRAGVLVRSLDDTVAGLGPDGPAWRALFAPLAAGFDDLAEDTLGPVLRV